MPNFFNFFEQSISPSYLGVDIGTTSVKAVEVKQGKQLAEVVNYGILETSGYLARTNQAIQASSLKLFEKGALEFLKILLREMKPQSNEAIASVPTFAAFMTTLDFPDMTAGDLAKAIVFQAQQYVPLPLSEVAVDWMKVGESTDEKGFKHQQILLISLPQELIKKYQAIFKSAGLRLRSLEIESLSLARILGGSDPTPTVVIDIGSRSTNIAFLDGGHLKFNAQSDFAGFSLTQALSTSLGINPLRAEELKRERGITGTAQNYELSTIMLPLLDATLNEVKQAIYKYGVQFPGVRTIERAVLSGGGANLLGIAKYFERELGFPAVLATPLARFQYRPDLEPVVPELNPNLTVALGLGLKEF